MQAMSEPDNNLVSQSFLADEKFSSGSEDIIEELKDDSDEQ